MMNSMMNTKKMIIKMEKDTFHQQNLDTNLALGTFLQQRDDHVFKMIFWNTSQVSELLV